MGRYRFFYVSRIAHKMKKEIGLNFSSCMRKSWTFVKIRTLMKTNIVRFEYLKNDGTVRKARGTHNLKFIPKKQWPPKNNIYFLDMVRYYDLDKKDWRAFKAEQIILEDDEI